MRTLTVLNWLIMIPAPFRLSARSAFARLNAKSNATELSLLLTILEVIRRFRRMPGARRCGFSRHQSHEAFHNLPKHLWDEEVVRISNIPR